MIMAMQISPIKQPTHVGQKDDLSDRQRTYLQRFIQDYTHRTRTSKQLTQKYRPVLADVRGSAGFRFPIKEMIYPIIGKRAVGARMWDVDDNAYVDLMMGFGVNLLGHNPDFIHQALAERLTQGIQIGPQSDLAGEVAELVCDLTGMERVTFSNTGTEAVMTAIRIARAATGRHKIALFANSYHGHCDSTLVKTRKTNEALQTIPETPGVSPTILQDVLLLEYGNARSLEIIQAHASELAAVLVEPVQNSRIELQPQSFLRDLRQVTQASGIVLIFDEMLTGFRIHPGGAQAWFGVQADIATYGKIAGGGMPIGIIAGKAPFMDYIDGGLWHYGDDSSPSEETIFFAGTYCKHPLAMAAARVVLTYLKQQGPSLQEQLNQRTGQFVNRLNTYFADQAIPLQMAHFGSIFNTLAPPEFDEPEIAAEVATSLANLDLIYYHLIHRGVYLRSGGGLLSTAHTDEDLDYVFAAVQDSITDMQAGGFLPT
jgi:glutamate-1-semialdehyde 2,1-aminomutase